MLPQPIIEQAVPRAGSFMMSGLEGGIAQEIRPEISRLSRGDRRLVIYPADSGFDILEDIDRVTDYALEPNIFFSPRFLVPAMPRIDEREVRLMLLQDGPSGEAETRFLMPVSIERSGFPLGPEVIRAWSNSYGPYGIPIVERREASRILDDLLSTLGDPNLGMPKVLVLPDIMMESPVISALRLKRRFEPASPA